MCANYKVSKFANQIYEGLTKTKHVAKIIVCIHTDLSKSSRVDKKNGTVKSKTIVIITNIKTYSSYSENLHCRTFL